MESFTFLKYLRGGAVAGNQRAAVSTTTIAASACEDGGEGGGGGDVVDDDAAFFDLEFAVPGDESAASDAEEERVEFNFSVAGDVASGAEVVAVEPVALASEDVVGKEAELAATAEPPAASFLRPATKFRVLLLKLRKPKVTAPAEGNGGAGAGALPPRTNRFLIKFRVEDAPFASLFTRDNSSRTSDAGTGAGAARPTLQAPQPSEAVAITAEERRFAKEVMLKYLNKIKPLYVKVSRRYGERLRFAGASEGEETDAEPEPEPEPSPSATPSPAPSSQQPRAPAPQPVVVAACGVRAPRASVPAGLKQACKRLGKSRSASSAVAAAPSPSQTPPTPTQPQRRDDSLLQLQDGIQSAIAHCKRSFNASKGSESPLLRSMTDPTPRLDAGSADTKDSGEPATAREADPLGW